MRLSHDANGMTRLPTKTLDGGQVTNRRPSRGKTARAAWHHRGARVARQRCPILRGGRRNIPLPAVGCKALNATVLSLQTIAKVTNSLGREPHLPCLRPGGGDLKGGVLAYKRLVHKALYQYWLSLEIKGLAAKCGDLLPGGRSRRTSGLPDPWSPRPQAAGATSVSWRGCSAVCRNRGVSGERRRCRVRCSQYWC